MSRLLWWVRQSRVRRAGVSLVPEDFEFEGLKALADVRFDVMKREDRGTQPRRDEVEGVGLEDERPEQLADRPGRREVPEREDRGRHAQPVVGRSAAQHLEVGHELRALHITDGTAAAAREQVVVDVVAAGLLGGREAVQRRRDTIREEQAERRARATRAAIERRARAERAAQAWHAGLGPFVRPPEGSVLVGRLAEVLDRLEALFDLVGRSRVAARSVVGAPGAVAPGAGVPTVGDPAGSPLSPPSVGGSVGPVGDDGPSLSSPTGARGAGDLS